MINYRRRLILKSVGVIVVLGSTFAGAKFLISDNKTKEVRDFDNDGWFATPTESKKLKEIESRK